MSPPTPISINNNLPSGNPCIPLWSANNKPTRRLNMINRAVIQHILWNDLLNDFFVDFFTKGFSGDFSSVLRGNDDCVDAEGDQVAGGVLAVFNCDLGF